MFMETHWEEIIKEAAKAKVYESEGRVVCFSCGKDLGEFKGKGTSHSICPECKSKMEKEAGGRL